MFYIYIFVSLGQQSLAALAQGLLPRARKVNVCELTVPRSKVIVSVALSVAIHVSNRCRIYSSQQDAIAYRSVT
jgi:hypothetical protein